jgi:hypothetical protein
VPDIFNPIDRFDDPIGPIVPRIPKIEIVSIQVTGTWISRAIQRHRGLLPNVSCTSDGLHIPGAAGLARKLQIASLKSSVGDERTA